MGVSFDSPVALRLFINGMYSFLFEAGGGAVVSCCTAATLLSGVFFEVLAMSVRFELTNGVFAGTGICAKYQAGRSCSVKIVKRVFHVILEDGNTGERKVELQVRYDDFSVFIY
jgi:hypothetical protein